MKSTEQSSEEPLDHIRAHSFAVADEPFCLWSRESQDENLDFLRSLEPLYFDHVAAVHLKGLESEHPQFAAMALRSLYGQALEVFIAMVGATIQAPYAVVGYLQKYKPHHLRALLEQIRHGNPTYSFYRPKPFTWKGLARAVFRHLAGVEDGIRSQLEESFARSWREFADEYLDEAGRLEYNSLKHGLRVSSGGFGLAIGPYRPGGQPNPQEQMHNLGASEFGTTFHVARNLPKSRTNFTLVRRGRNWNPEHLAMRIKVLSYSVHNLISFLRLKCGDRPASIQMVWPRDLGMFDVAWGHLNAPFEVELDPIPSTADIPPLSHAEILAVYDAESGESSGKKE